jgi:hypothetical protein
VSNDPDQKQSTIPAPEQIAPYAIAEQSVLDHLIIAKEEVRSANRELVSVPEDSKADLQKTIDDIIGLLKPLTTESSNERRFNLIKLACVIVIVASLIFLLQINGFPIGTTKSLELIAAALIGGAARLLVDISRHTETPAVEEEVDDSADLIEKLVEQIRPPAPNRPNY